jgi:uncharacterized protein (DUF1501 family)
LAFELLTSGPVAEAFRLEREPERVRDRYGRNQFGQSLLLARRLVQAGVPIIQANMGIVQSWDTHGDNWGRLKTALLPKLDRALTALVDDLEAEGRLPDTLVAALGEFGRTPRISKLAGSALPGRDHWAAVYSGLFAGGGCDPPCRVALSREFATPPRPFAPNPSWRTRCKRSMSTLMPMEGI